MISWNIENISNNYFTLHSFAQKFSAKLIFLSEPMIYKCDLSPILQTFSGSYEAYLNSEDIHDPDLPLTHPKAKGGTMVFWHKSLSPFLKVLPTCSPSFVSVLLSPPGILPSLHTAVYLPTAGKDGDWLATIMDLENHVAENVERYGDVAVFLRGDFNASSKNKFRAAILGAVTDRLNLHRVTIWHPTYHHFTGGGASDSDLDLLLYGGGLDVHESLVDVKCKFKEPLMFSHHDLLVSVCSIPPRKSEEIDTSKNITAPRIPNDRFSTKWSDEGVSEYSDMLSSLLPQI